MDPLKHIRSAAIDEIDPFAADILRREDEQQIRQLILIPSVSAAPRSVLEALGSSIQNVCAEGLPSTRMVSDSTEELKDVSWQLANNRRYSDRRFYKGVDYVDFAESLAKQRTAEAFAHGEIRPEDLHVSVQALSGGIANLAVYQALIEPGDTLMGMSLNEGGHLSHGSRFNLSGQMYNVISYAADPATERLDYDRIRALARQHRPRLLIAGYTAYPWAPDWQAFREIADETGAYFMADIAHTAGLVVAGVIPSPVGIADVVSLTTNKTLCGPRSAAVLTLDKHLAQKIEMAVFPGQQGAPHPNKFVAVAVAFEIAKTEAFRELQHQIVRNARALAEGLQKRGVRIVYGGTDTHLFLVDLKSIQTPTGQMLYGEPAARILELADIIVNKNGIPGDKETALATGLRMGTPWLSQRGLTEPDMDQLAGLIHTLLTSIHPFTYNGLYGTLPRGKIDLDILEQVRAGVGALVAKTNDAGAEILPGVHHTGNAGAEILPGVHHTGNAGAEILPGVHHTGNAEAENQPDRFIIRGERARQFIQQIATANLAGLEPGEEADAYLLDRRGLALDRVRIRKNPDHTNGQAVYALACSRENGVRIAAWLWSLSDGYVLFDKQDVYRKVEGPVTIEAEQSNDPLPDSQARGRQAADLHAETPGLFDLRKPYFIGQDALLPISPEVPPAPWPAYDEKDEPLQQTPLFEVHGALGARLVPFAGWEMPLRYASVNEEHNAVRDGAGLFDVAHMGIFEFRGPHAVAFLDTVFSNYVAWLEDLQACYGYLLNTHGNVIDDAIVYRLQPDRYLMVVNAANEHKAWVWLNRVNAGRTTLDSARPWVQVEAQTEIRNLKDPSTGNDQLRDLALQGPGSLPTLLALAEDSNLRFRIRQMAKNSLLPCRLAGIRVILARTGYTGEEWGFELFVHPGELTRLWDAVLSAGEPFGVRPVGLGARDSLRIEAGLPLFGQELAGPYSLDPIEAGFPGFVKYHKPFFIGRDALLVRESDRRRTLVRFLVDTQRARMLHLGDPLLSESGELVGRVTSCSLDGQRRLVGLGWVRMPQPRPSSRLFALPLGGRDIPPEDIAAFPEGRRQPLLVLPRFRTSDETREHL